MHLQCGACCLPRHHNPTVEDSNYISHGPVKGSAAEDREA